MVHRPSGKYLNLAYKRTCPRHIIKAVSNSAVCCTRLGIKFERYVHYSRLRPVGTTVDGCVMSFHEESVQMASVYGTVEAIVGTERKDGQIFGHGLWSSTDGIEDKTWQPFRELCEDEAEVVRDFVNATGNSNAAEDSCDLEQSTACNAQYLSE